MYSNEQYIVKKKITWVTPDYFVDCDFNPNIFSEILKYFDIHWIILLPNKNARFSKNDFTTIQQLQGVTVEFFYWTNRARNPKMLFFFEKIYRRIKELKADLVYFNYVPDSPYVLPLYWRLEKNKTIVTAHDGDVKPSFKMPWLSKNVFNLAFSTVKYVNMFSLTQSLVFKSIFKKAKVFTIPLGLKDFGVSSLTKSANDIVFLFFGSIHSNKNLELLIDAACNLFDHGVRGFKIAIHGACANWQPYYERIKYPELFECDIRLHANSEIAGLFAQSHYAVYPYKELSQSGALKVAFNYNVPVIVSDLEGFTDEVKNGENGFVFKSESVLNLEQIMTEIIKNHSNEYLSIQRKSFNYNNDNYSEAMIASKYINMFNEVLSKNMK